MVIENYAKKWKDEIFADLSVKDRHAQFMRIINSILIKTKKISQGEHDALVTMIVDDRLEASHSVNKFLTFFAGVWLSEVFDIRVIPNKPAEPKAEPAESKTEPEVAVEYDDEYDPEMLKLAGEHPEEWSKEVVKQEIAANDKWSEDE